MATLWSTIKKYAGQIGITYNQSAKTYNQASTTYNGKLGTVWTSINKS